MTDALRAAAERTLRVSQGEPLWVVYSQHSTSKEIQNAIYCADLMLLSEHVLATVEADDAPGWKKLRDLIGRGWEVRHVRHSQERVFVELKHKTERGFASIVEVHLYPLTANEAHDIARDIAAYINQRLGIALQPDTQAESKTVQELNKLREAWEPDTQQGGDN